RAAPSVTIIWRGRLLAPSADGIGRAGPDSHRGNLMASAAGMVTGWQTGGVLILRRPPVAPALDYDSGGWWRSPADLIWRVRCDRCTLVARRLAPCIHL